ncbi:hypothetical protein KJ652_00635 [Patescibacteria group bacterium]|nr:hypothetical protein [Patescibacteria group bacterium]
MPNIFTLIGTSWEFYKKQPVLNEVVFWLMTLPLATIMILSDWAEKQETFKEIAENGVELGITDIRPVILLLLLNVFLSVVMLWGVSCVLVVGKRLITSKAGRSRSSFEIVRKDGSKFVLTLFMTDILRSCITLLWMILLIVPGIIYAIRTAFYHVTIVLENLGYRESLNRSNEVIKGHTWIALLYFIGLSVVLFLPPIIFIGTLEQAATLFDPRLMPAVFIVHSAILSFVIMIFTLATIVLYGEFLKLPRVTEVKT